MENLFSYGTLQQKQVQLDTFGRQLEGKEDILVGYALSTVKISDPDVIKSSGKDIHPILKFTGSETDEVAGTVFEVTSQEVAQSDEYEVEEYERVPAVLKSGRTTWIYAASN